MVLKITLKTNKSMKTKFYAACMTLCMFFLSTNTISAQHEYVDLGLSVKWATCNVGANVPEEFGNYFAWGETQSKENYTWLNYKYSNKEGTKVTKYCTDSIFGEVDLKIELLTEDDAATANWGEGWRMPTSEEWEELINNCTWTWTQHDTINGYLVEAANGNSIFLPAAGYYYGEKRNNVNMNGYYWSSTLDAGKPLNAWRIYFGVDFIGRKCYISRYHGRSIRPVHP